MNLEIANRLVQLRKSHHLSQEELAAKLGISRQAVSKWERAEASPDIDNLILLAQLYHISLDDLLQTGMASVATVEPQSNELQPPNMVSANSQETEIHAQQRQRIYFLQHFPYPVLVTILYLLLGFFFALWHPTWLVFLSIPIYYWLVDLYAESLTCGKNNQE